MKYKSRITVVFVFAVALVATSATGQSIQSRLMSLGISAARSPLEPIAFELEDLNGKTHNLSDYFDKVVFLNFWATWCGPCRFEMPSMERLHKELKKEGLEILAVDLQESNEQVQSFVDELDLTFTILMDRTGRVGAQYGARSIPTTYLIDREGKIFARAIGAREWDTPQMIDLFRSILRDGVQYEDFSE
jgi:thiol-disulfide isomerase/thioredoxin